MVRLIAWIVVLLLALSFFGVSLKSLVNSPTNKENVSFISQLLHQGWATMLSWLHNLLDPIVAAMDASPSFSNATQVTVSDDSVVLQFAYVRPDHTTGQLISEIVLSPKHAIDFSRALDATIKQHFTRHLDDLGY
jgi:hypothetical protein